MWSGICVLVLQDQKGMGLVLLSVGGVSCRLLRPGLNLTFSSVTDGLKKKLDLHQS